MSRRRAKTLGEAKCGRHHQSTEPCRETSAAVRRSPISPYSSSRGWPVDLAGVARRRGRRTGGELGTRRKGAPGRTLLAGRRGFARSHGAFKSDPNPPDRRAKVAEWLMRRTADPFLGGSIPSLGSPAAPSDASSASAGRRRALAYFVAVWAR